MDGLSNLDYPERLKRINLPTLAYRRQRGDMIEVFKHFNSYDRSTLAATFKPRPSLQHKLQLFQPPSKDGIRGPQRNSFYHRVAPMWNNLPKNVAEAETIEGFKNALDKLWEDDPLKFNHLHHRVTDEDEE